MPLAPGDVFAGYTVLRQLGTGGMGAVYLVRHPRLPRMDALKLLHPEFSADPDFAARFLREAEVVAGLSHRNIVPVLDRGEHDGQLWLTMRYVEGIDAETALEQAGGLLPPRRAVHIVAEVAAALDAAHRRHLVHRDVKPANILLASPADDEDEQVFLTDFGIAKDLDGATELTRTGMVVATFDYGSPEQIEGRPLDSRSDVYSLGCVLYKLLTGSVPFPGPTVAAALHGHLSLPPPRPTERVPWLAPAIDDVVSRAMAKDPADRYPTCRALAAAAGAAVTDFPDPPAPPYTVTLIPATSGTPVVGPVGTDRLTRAQTERLVGLVRRTRFFDLPETLAGDPAAGRGRTVTIDIGAGTRRRRVVADLADPRRPPELADLVTAIEGLRRTAPPPPVPAPSTVLEAVPAPAAVPPFAARPTVGPRTYPPVPPPAPPFHPPAPVPGPAPGPAPATPDGRRGRGRAVALAVAAAVLVAAVVTAVLLVPGGGDDGGGTDPTASVTTPPSSDPAEEALAALPRAAPLPAGTLVVPFDEAGNIDLYLVDATSGARGTRLTTDAGVDAGPLLAADRATVVYLRVLGERTELRAVAVDGSGDRPLFADPPVDCTKPQRPAWNPVDQTQIALACHDDPEAVSLRLVTLDGATVRTLDPGAPVVDDLTFSADGTRIAYWAGEPGSTGGSLFALPVDGTAGAAQLTEDAHDVDPVWSPDGGTVAFARQTGPGTRQIYLVGADGTGERPISPSGAVDQGPTWAPDGATLIFKSNRPGEGGAVSGDRLWAVDASGSGLRQVDPDGVVVSTPAWGHR
jgi:serine/threonine-protein kinase